MLGTWSYFCTPYTSQERGTVENTGGLVRRFFPKRTNFDTLRRKEVKAVERWLNVLKAGGTLTPLELMRAAGIDMHSPAPIHDAVAYVGSLIDELELAFPV